MPLKDVMTADVTPRTSPARVTTVCAIAPLVQMIAAIGRRYAHLFFMDVVSHAGVARRVTSSAATTASPQSRGAAALEPSSMREDDALGIERDESRRGSRSFGAVQLQQSADIGGRLAIRRQNSERERHDTPQWGELLRLDVENEICE